MASCDADFDDVVALLHFDGANGGVVFADNSQYARPVSVTASAVTDTGTKKYGTASLKDPGDNASYVSFANAAELNIATGNWTFDFWVRRSSGAGLQIRKQAFTSVYPMSFDMNTSGGIAVSGADGTGTGAYALLGTTLAADTWQFVSVQRSGNTFELYQDGVLTDTDTYSGTLGENTAAWRIGTASGGDAFVDDFRMTVGTARYSGNFTPPTEQLPNGPCTPCDPLYANVVALLHMDGPDGGVSFPDSSSYNRTVSVDASAITDTAVVKYGTASLYLPPDSTSFISFANAPELNIATGDFVIDFWAYRASSAGAFSIRKQSFTSVQPCVINCVGGNALAVAGSNGVGAGAYALTALATFPSGQWVFCSVQRSGDTFTLWQDGVLQDTDTYSGTLGENTSAWRIGPGSSVDVWIDDFRFTVGAARYTANFTPPTEALPGAACPAATEVPDVVGESLEDATTAIEAADLVVGTVTYEYSETVPEGDVISQDPEGGEMVAPGSSVGLVISLGPLTEVPDVVGESLEDATTAIEGVGLTVGDVTYEYSETVPEGDVISQDPEGGEFVVPGSAVDLVISLGPSSTVPNVLGLSQPDAEAAFTSEGLVLGTVGAAYSDFYPIDTVATQDPTGGSIVAAGSSVDIEMSLGPPGVVVPNVVNATLVDATAILESAGLTVGALSNAFSESVPAGSVISQAPIAGVTVSLGTPVALVISSGPAVISVPDVVGMTSSDAADTLRGAGLRVGRITVDTSGETPLGLIASQFANAGALVAAGTKINLVLSSIAPPFEVDSTVISQYAQSATLVEMVENMAAYIDPRINLTEFYAYVWNVDTAQGFGLDVWGKIVGVGRLLRIVADDPIFGFDNASTPPPDWQPWSQGRFARNTGEGGEAVILPDDAYRILILTKALANIASTSSAAINQLLRNLFPGRGKAYVEDLGGMEMRFVFDFVLTPVEYAIVSQSGALPHPAGVALSVSVPP